MSSQAGHVPLESRVMQALQALKRHGINFLAIDFDYTLVPIKTEKKHDPHDIPVREVFKRFIPLAVENNMHIAIVTFAKHPELVAKVLAKEFESPVAQNIVIRSNEPNSFRQWNPTSTLDKQTHIASAACELIGHNLHITRRSTLLIDDEFSNVHSALQDEVNAVRFDPESPETFLQDILDVYI